MATDELRLDEDFDLFTLGFSDDQAEHSGARHAGGLSIFQADERD